MYTGLTRSRVRNAMPTTSSPARRGAVLPAACSRRAANFPVRIDLAQPFERQRGGNHLRPHPLLELYSLFWAELPGGLH